MATTTMATSESEPCRIPVTTWNANFDTRALTGPFSWDARKEAVLAAILRFGSDFVCLQELRPEAVRYLQASPALTETYDMAYGRTNATDLSFCLVTLWNKKKWSCSASRSLWFGADDAVADRWVECPTGNGFGRFAFEAKFYPAVFPEGKGKPVGCATPAYRDRALLIYNAHFGLGEAERMLQARALHAEAVRVHAAAPEAGVVICGDFNTFPDTGGAAEVGLLEGRPGEGRSAAGAPVFRDVVPYGHPIRTFTGGKVIGTQISYPYDTWVRFKGTDHEEVHPVEGEMGGRLDHIFYSTAELSPFAHVLQTRFVDGSIARAEDLGFRKADVAPRFPSDHLALSVTFDRH